MIGFLRSSLKTLIAIVCLYFVYTLIPNQNFKEMGFSHLISFIIIILIYSVSIIERFRKCKKCNTMTYKRYSGNKYSGYKCHKCGNTFEYKQWF